MTLFRDYENKANPGSKELLEEYDEHIPVIMKRIEGEDLTRHAVKAAVKKKSASVDGYYDEELAKLPISIWGLVP